MDYIAWYESHCGAKCALVALLTLMQNVLRKSLFPERYPDFAIYKNGSRDDFMTTHHSRSYQ